VQRKEPGTAQGDAPPVPAPSVPATATATRN